MARLLPPLVVAAAILLLIPVPALSQTAPTPPPASVVPGPGLVGPPAARLPSPLPLPEKLLDGPVKSVDPRAKTVQVGGALGLLSTTLAVTEDTQIAVEGAPASLQDLREGDEVNASYETREGKNVATSIGVTHPEATGGAGPMKRGPGSSTAPQGMELREPPAPPPGGAKSP